MSEETKPDSVFQGWIAQDEKIKALTAEIELLKKQKELAEAKLELIATENLIVEQKLDLLTSQTTAEKVNYETNLSVTTLKMDWLAAAKELEFMKDLMSENGITGSEARENICINFSNKLRLGALKELEKDPDDILVLKATAYEVYYKGCVAILENRNLAFKLKARDRFTEAVKENRQKKAVKETEKVERQRAQDPREKMIDTLMNLGKMSREQAIQQLDGMQVKVKELIQK